MVSVLRERNERGSEGMAEYSKNSIYDRAPVVKRIESSEGEIWLTAKHIALINDKTRFQIIEGKTGSSKSIIGGIAAFHRIFKSPREDNQYVIAAASIDTLERMIIDNKATFFNVYNKVCVYKSAGIGGARIEVTTPTGLKKLYLVGYDNQARYKKILGLGIKGFIIEEAHVAPDGFISELFTRLYRNDAWLYATMNAGLPDQMVYMNYFNKARPHPDWVHEVPSYMMEELEKLPADSNFRYWFFRFEDNPTMSDRQISELWGSHPEGSYEYNSKVLARRGFVEGLLYARLLERAPEIRFEKIDDVGLSAIYIGIDIGSSNIGGSAKTVFTMVGITRDADRVYIIDSKEVKSKYEEPDYNEIVESFDSWLDTHWDKLGYLITQVRVDKSSPLFKNQLRNNSKYRLSVQSSTSGKIALRIVLKQQLLFQNRMIFTNLRGSSQVAIHLKRVRSDGKDGHVDENSVEIDYSDSLDYALEPIAFRLTSFKQGLDSELA
jgi:phage terminase large subunit